MKRTSSGSVHLSSGPRVPVRSFERAPIAVQLKRIGDATEKLHVACKLYHFRAFRLFKGLIKPLACLTILSQSYQNSQRLTHIIHNWGHVRVLCRLPTAELQRPMSSRGTLWTFCSAFARPMLKIRSQCSDARQRNRKAPPKAALASVPAA